MKDTGNTGTKYGDLVTDGPDGNNRVIATWKEKPFTGIDKRRWTVEHRIVVDWHEGVGVDIRHEVRCEEMESRDGWEPAEVYEAREHGVDRLSASKEWWQ